MAFYLRKIGNFGRINVHQNNRNNHNPSQSQSQSSIQKQNSISNSICFHDTNSISDILYLKKITSFNDQQNVIKQYTYCSNVEKNIFKTDIKIDNQNVMDIKISASFIVNINKFKEGSVIVRIKINDTLINENEVGLINNQYVNISLNYAFNVAKKSLYTVEIYFEGLLITTEKEQEDPILNIRNNGASLSILVV